MKADDYQYDLMKAKVLDKTKPYKERLNNIFQWIKDDRINPTQMAVLNVLLQMA
jgi:hypothetical protein